MNTNLFSVVTSMSFYLCQRADARERSLMQWWGDTSILHVEHQTPRYNDTSIPVLIIYFKQSAKKSCYLNQDL
jgi:hypothetical protein